MDFFSDPQATAARFGDVIDDLHDVFRCHGVDFGSPEDFFAFGRTLKYHSELRSDVMRVVKFVMDSETNVSFRTLLTVLAVASGGTEVAAGGRELRVPVSLVIESLVGEGDSSLLNGEVDERTATEPAAKEAVKTVVLESPSLEMPALEKASVAKGAAAGISEEAPASVEAEGVFIEEAAKDVSINSVIQTLSDPEIETGTETTANLVRDRRPLMGRNDSNALAESLSRIEMNSLQLKIYLDSIEQRISRMEPRLENVPPAAASGSPAGTRARTEAIFSAVVASAIAPSEAAGELTDDALRRNDVASHDLPKSEDLPKNEPRGSDLASNGLSRNDAARVEPGKQEKVVKSSPAVLRKVRSELGHFDVLKRRNVFPILVGLAILLFAITISWRIRRDSGSVVVRPASALVQGLGDAGASSPVGSVGSGGSDPSTGTVGGSKAVVAEARSAAPAGNARSVDAVSANSGERHDGYASKPDQRLTDVDLPSPKKPARVALRSSFSAPPAGDTDSPDAAADTSVDADPPDRTTKLNSESLTDRPVNVSSGVMAANLLSGPKPSYPKLANLTHMRGDVVMLAVISKDGTVKDLHVIKGHRLLRGAAKSAVRNWRYRPYMINGVPVDVSTLVSVDFSPQ